MVNIEAPGNISHLNDIFLLTDDLAIDYQFTFNLSKSDDKHFTAINFKNEPTKMDVDVEFSISCSVAAKVLPYLILPDMSSF